MKPGPNVSIELLKSISMQKAHKTCHKQGSKLHYLGTNHLANFFVDHPSLELKLENDVELGIYEVGRRP